MQFDPDIARNILLAVEALPANEPVRQITLDGIDDNTLYEHIELLKDAGYVEAVVQYSGGGKERIALALVKRLTHAGHEFLADSRDEHVWEKTKRLVKEKGGAASFAILAAVAKKYAAERFGISF